MCNAMQKTKNTHFAERLIIIIITIFFFLLFIAPYKRQISTKKKKKKKIINKKKSFLDTHWNHLTEVIPRSTYNIQIEKNIS